MRNSKASFCVIARDDVRPEKYTTYFKSVIAFGRIKALEEDSEKRKAIERLALKYNPDADAGEMDAAIEREYAPLCMLELDIEHLTGKQAKELMSTY